MYGVSGASPSTLRSRETFWARLASAVRPCPLRCHDFPPAPAKYRWPLERGESRQSHGGATARLRQCGKVRTHSAPDLAVSFATDFYQSFFIPLKRIAVSGEATLRACTHRR